MKIKKYSKFLESNALRVAKEIDMETAADRYYQPQLNTVDNSYNEGLLRYLWDIAEIRQIDAIGGTEAPSGVRRYSINGKVEFEDIIHMAPTGLACGIKVVKYPIGTLMDYQNWPGGYIEGFVRMKSDDLRFGEYFIWTYIRMTKLMDILERFDGKIELL